MILPMKKHWQAEIWRGVILLSVALVLGWEYDMVEWALVLLLAGYLVLNVLHLVQMEIWLENRHQTPPPPAFGAWEHIYAEIYGLRQRFRRRKRRLGNIIKRFRRTTSALPDATVLLNEDGFIEWFNVSAVSLLGLQRGRDVGQRLENLIRHPDFIHFLHTKEDRPDSLVFSMVERPGEVLSARVVELGKGMRLVLLRDVSGRHRLENMQKEFVANVSHELRTPLTVVRGYVEALQDLEASLPPGLNEPLREIDKQSRRMESIVQDLLVLSRLEVQAVPEQPGVVGMDELVRGVVQDTASLIDSAEHSVKLELDKNLDINGDAEQIHGAITNLLVNAVRHTQPGGIIRIVWQAQENGARLSVQDNGEGIPAEHLGRLGERFYRVDEGRSRDKGGTGLGLAIVKQILSRHHARLEVDSEVGKGSTFHCVFEEAALVRPE